MSGRTSAALILVILLSGPGLRAQQITQVLRGTVTDKQSHVPLPGVIITVLGTEPLLATATDENGHFRFPGVPVGRYQLAVRTVGYRERAQMLALVAGKEAVVNVELEENVVEAEEVVITGEQDKTKTNNRMNSVSARVFSAEEAARYAGSRNDPARMAANFAGVSGANDSRNDIIIRGNSPMGILWRLNGIDIPNPNHFGNSGSTGGPISILNNNTLDNSDFLTGAFPADYGNATAGVFDLRMRQGNNEKFEFLGQVGFNGFELGAEGPLGRRGNSSFLANYRYSTLSVFKALNIDFGTGDAVPQYQDASFRVDLNSGKAGKFTAWGVGGLSYIALLESDKKEGQDLYGFSARDTYFRSNVGATGVTHNILLKDNAYLRTNAGISGNINIIEADRIDTSFKTPRHLKPEYRQNTSTVRYAINSTYNRKINSRDFVSAGFYAELFATTFVDSNDLLFGDNTFEVLRNYSGTSSLLRALVQWQHRFSDKLVMNIGASAQYFTLNGSVAPEPRAGLKYSLTQKQVLSVGAGLHSQLQPFYIYFATEEIGGQRVMTNRELDFLRAAHAVLSYDYNFARLLRLKAELYYQHLYKVPVHSFPSYFSIVNLGADFTSPNITGLVSEGTGDNYGTELTVEKFYDKGYYFLLTASLFQSKYRGSDKVLRNTAFNGNYVFNALGGKELRIRERHTLIVDVRATFSGGKRYTPIDLDSSRAVMNEVRDGSRAYELRYPSYFRMDVKPGYRYNSRRVTHEFSVDIQNVTRNLNVFQQSYDITNGRLKTDYQLRFFVIPQYRILF
jgi:hypothetical protein